MFIAGWWFQILFFFPFHIWDVIRNPLTNSMIFQDGYCTTNQTYGVWACLKFGYTASCRFKRANEDEAKICWGTFGAPYSRWTQVIKMVGFFRIFQAKKHQKAKKKQWLSTLRHPDFPTSQVSHVDFPGPLRSPRSMLIPTGPGDGGTFHAISRCELTDVRVRHGDPCLYSNYLGMDPYLLSYFWGNEPSFTTYFDVRGFWCSLTMGDHGINVRISPAAAIAISSLWTPTFFGSDFDQGPRFFWLQRPSFCFCIQWQMYMYLSVCLSVCLFVYLYLYPDIYTHTLHTCKLVGGLEHLDFFSISQKWECHHPNWLF